MGRIRYTRNDTHELHAVRCADCGRRETIELRAGSLERDRRFNSLHEYRCTSCRKGQGTLFDTTTTTKP